MMKLSLKAVGFVIEALENYQHDHDRRLSEPNVPEDEISDLTNDRQYLDAIKKDFEKYRDELLRNHENVGIEA